jgi:hypothetical protein
MKTGQRHILWLERGSCYGSLQLFECLNGYGYLHQNEAVNAAEHSRLDQSQFIVAFSSPESSSVTFPPLPGVC